MKTHINCIVPALLLIVTLTTNSMGQQMQTPQFFTDKNRYISFILPEGWRMRQSDDSDPRTKLVFNRTDEDTRQQASLTILAYKVDTPRTLDSLKSFLTNRLTLLRHRGATFTDIEETSVAQTTFVQTRVMSDGNTSLILLGYPDNVLCLDIVYHAPDQIYDRYFPDVRTVTESLVTLKGAVQDDPELKEKQRMIWLKKQAFLYMDQQDYDTAREMLIELSSAEPENYSFYFYIGMTYLQQDKYDEASEYFSKAVQVFPGYWEAYFQNGVTAMHKEDYQGAVTLFEKTMAINPKSVEAAIDLAIAYRKLGEPEKAVGLYKKLLEMNPTNQVYLFNLGRTYSDMGDFEQAKSCFEKCIEIDPAHASAMVNLAYLYRSVSDYKKARELCERALSHDATLEQAETLLNELKQVEGQ